MFYAGLAHFLLSVKTIRISCRQAFIFFEELLVHHGNVRVRLHRGERARRDAGEKRRQPLGGRRGRFALRVLSRTRGFPALQRFAQQQAPALVLRRAQDPGPALLAPREPPR